jgi:hypothetical protein
MVGTPASALRAPAGLAHPTAPNFVGSVPRDDGAAPVEAPVQAGAHDVVGQANIARDKARNRRIDVSGGAEVGVQVFELERVPTLPVTSKQ